MNAVTEYTLSEMILLAAQKLEEQGQSPFSAEELIVSSWREFPKPFGLKGYADQFPDSNRVLSAIMGERGLARRGWLSKMGQKLYALSAEGKRMVERIVSGEPEEEDEPVAVRLPREQEKVLLGLLDSSAYQKFTNKRAHEMSFADACRFWGITENLSSDALDKRLDMISKTVNQVERLAAKKELTINHREITPTDLELLQEVHAQLQDRFARHLTLLRARSK